MNLLIFNKPYKYQGSEPESLGLTFDGLEFFFILLLDWSSYEWYHDSESDTLIKSVLISIGRFIENESQTKLEFVLLFSSSHYKSLSKNKKSYLCPFTLVN